MENRQTLVVGRSADNFVYLAELWLEDLWRNPIQKQLINVLPHIQNEPIRVNGRLVTKPWKGTGIVAVTDKDRNLVACRPIGAHSQYDRFGKPIRILEFPAIKKAIVRGELEQQRFVGGIASNYPWLKEIGKYQYHAGDAAMNIDGNEYYIGTTLAMATAEHVLAMFCLPAVPIFINLLSRMPSFEWTQAGLFDTRMAESVGNKLSRVEKPLSGLSIVNWNANS